MRSSPCDRSWGTQELERAPEDQASPQATRAVVLGVASIPMLIIFPINYVAAVAALIFARKARWEIASSGGRLGGGRKAGIGRACAWVSIVWMPLALLLILVLLPMFALPSLGSLLHH